MESEKGPVDLFPVEPTDEALVPRRPCDGKRQRRFPSPRRGNPRSETSQEMGLATENAESVFLVPEGETHEA